MIYLIRKKKQFSFDFFHESRFFYDKRWLSCVKFEFCTTFKISNIFDLIICFSWTWNWFKKSSNQNRKSDFPMRLIFWHWSNGFRGPWVSRKQFWFRKDRVIWSFLSNKTALSRKAPLGPKFPRRRKHLDARSPKTLEIDF